MCIYKISFHPLTHLQLQFCIEIHKFHIPIKVKMNQFNVDANDCIFQCAIKNNKLFLWELSLYLKMLERGGSLPVKSLKMSFKPSHTGRSLVLNSGGDEKI